MTSTLFANPGQTVTICLQVTNSDGELADGYDGYQAPTVDFVRMPDASNAASFPTIMTEIETGIWIHNIVIPSGTSARGSYIVSCSYSHPTTHKLQNELFLISVSAPFGNSSVSFS